MTHTLLTWIPCNLHPPTVVVIAVSNLDFAFLVGMFPMSNSLEVKESPLWAVD
jgi:hypothetical protein